MRESADQATRGPDSRATVSWWVKAFVAFHLLAITSWSLPRPSEDLRTGQRKLGVSTQNPSDFFASLGNLFSDGLLLVNEKHVKTSPVRLYNLSTGFWQYWDMFAPNPSDTDFYGTAKITYRDGTVREYRYPRMFDLGLGDRYLKERYRKFYERAHLEMYSYVWPAFGQRVALLNYDDPNNPPSTVELTRHWLKIAPPGKPQGSTYSQFTYYTHKVDVAELERMDP